MQWLGVLTTLLRIEVDAHANLDCVLREQRAKLQNPRIWQDPCILYLLHRGLSSVARLDRRQMPHVHLGAGAVYLKICDLNHQPARLCGHPR